MILEHLKHNTIKTLLITLLICIVCSVIFISSQSLNYVEVTKLPFYLKAYTYLILPISNDFRYLFIFTTIHIFSFLVIYLIFLFYEMRKKTPIEKYLPISLNKFLIKKYIAILIELLIIITTMFVLFIIFSFNYYNQYFSYITHTYLITIAVLLVAAVIDFFLFKHRLRN